MAGPKVIRGALSGKLNPSVSPEAAALRDTPRKVHQREKALRGGWQPAWQPSEAWQTSRDIFLFCLTHIPTHLPIIPRQAQATSLDHVLGESGRVLEGGVKWGGGWGSLPPSA